MNTTQPIEIGRVLRASTEGFTCGTRSPDIQYPSLGSFVQSNHEHSDLTIVGVITTIRIDDDPLVRQLIMASDLNMSALRDQRENRLIPVEIDVLSVGYVQDGQVFYNLPPRPPMSLDAVSLCNPADVAYFTDKLDFLRLILNSASLNGATPDLLGTAIRHATQTRPTDEQHDYLIQAGRYLAGLLSHDMTMLRYILTMLRPT